MSETEIAIAESTERAPQAVRSVIFRKERQQSWLDLEALLDRIEKRGLRTLSTDDLLRLPQLYRSAISSLSVARSISLDRNLLDYLEALCARAFFYVYGPRRPLLPVLAEFFAVGLPKAVRAQALPILVIAIVLAAAAIGGFAMTRADLSWYQALMPDSLAGGRTTTSTTEELRATLYPAGSILDQTWRAFSTFLFAHNTQVSFLMFALGFALAAPTVLLIIHNGLTVGAFVALFESHDLLVDVLAWLSIHGITEFGAIILAAAAGVRLGITLLFPGDLGRLDNLARQGPIAAQAAIGAMLMLVCAAVLEGVFRSWVQDIGLRFAIGVAAIVPWIAYFMLVGRRGRSAEDVG